MPARIALFMPKPRNANAIPESVLLADPQRRETPHVSRLWLLAFILLSAVITSSALILRYRLEGVEGAVAALAEARTGASFHFDDAEVMGIRAIRLHGVDVRLGDDPESTGASIEEMEVQFALIDLLRGELTLERIFIADADITLTPSALGFSAAGMNTTASAGRSSPLKLGALFLEGTNCRLAVNGLAGGKQISIDSIAFNLRKPSSEFALTGEATGQLSGAPNKTVELSGFIETSQRFALRVRTTGITADDLNPFLPAERRFVESGSLDAEARVESLPGAPMNIWIEAAVTDLSIRNRPAALPPFSGAINATMEYDSETSQLQKIAARADAEDWRGTVHGNIDFAQTSPAFDVEVDISPIPLNPLIEALLLDRLDPYGSVAIDVHPASSLHVNLAGNSSEPLATAQLRVPGADVSFQPVDPKWPGGELAFGPIEATWSTAESLPRGHATILRGSVTQEEYGIEVADIAGMINIDGTRVASETLSGTLTGQTFVGSFDYDVPTREGKFALSAGVADLEDTPLHERIHHTVLWGAASIRANGTLKPDEYSATIRADATQCRVLYNWWLDKPIGLAAAGIVEARFRPDRDITLNIDAQVAGSQVAGDMRMAKVGPKWRLMTAKFTSPHAEIPPIGRAVRMPYRFEGTTGSDIEYSWTRHLEGPDEWTAEARGKFDRIVATPDGGEHSFVLEGGEFDLTTNKGEQNRGDITIRVARGSTPPIRGSTWFIDPRKDDPLLEKYPRVPRQWTYRLYADNAVVPPWTGTEFEGEAYFDRPESSLRHFQAKVGEGTVSGAFQSNGVENLTRFNVGWEGIPSKYLIDYLNYPAVLSGPNTGSIEYSLDRDDPSTARGSGRFEVSGGQFSADYLITLLEGSEGLSAAILPRSLKFDSLSTDVSIQGDTVTTPNLTLESENLRITGDGNFILDGDMNYSIKVAMSPSTAEEIKPLRDALNLRGLKVAGQDVELGFTIKGPLFKPRGALAQLPTADVMLVTGALGVGTEIIDMPRQLLADVFKILAGAAIAN